jgi:WD40 repeat protein
LVRSTAYRIAYQFIYRVILGIALLLTLTGLPAKAQTDNAITLGRGNIHSVAWNGTGTALAVGGDRGIWIYTPELTDVAALRQGTGTVTALAWSADNTRIAAGQDDGTIQVWHVVENRLLGTLRGHIGRVNAVAWRPDPASPAMIASAGDDFRVRLWDSVTFEQVAPLERHTERVLSLAWHPDGSILLSGGADNTVRKWDIATLTTPATPQGHTDEILGLAWSPDGTLFATASRDGSLGVWRGATGERLLRIPVRDTQVFSVGWNADGTEVESVSHITETGLTLIQRWDAATGEARGSVEYDITITTAWTQNDTPPRLALVRYNGLLHIYDPATDRYLAFRVDHMGAALGLRVQDDTLQIYTHNAVRVWNPETEQLLDQGAMSMWELPDDLAREVSAASWRAEILPDGTVRVERTG